MYMAFLIIFLGLVAWLMARQGKASAARAKKLHDEVAEYVDSVRASKRLPTVKTDVFLKEGELAFLSEPSRLMETRAVRYGGGRGMRVRVMKGVSIGGFSGKSESHQEWRTLDSGSITLTNKRLIFNGSKENRVIALDAILSMDSMRDVVSISLENRAKEVSFAVQNSLIWSAVLQILKSGKDPMNLEGIDLTILS